MKEGFDRRPVTAQESMMAVAKLRNRSEYFNNKKDGETSKIQLGNERRPVVQRHGTPLSGHGAATDYRSNFQWTIPKFAQWDKV